MKIKWKEIFRPTKAKIILPVALCLFFIIAISLNYYYADRIGNLLCELETRFQLPATRAYLANDTALGEEIIEDLNLYVGENQISEALGIIVEFNDDLFSELSPFYIELFTIMGEGEPEPEYSYLSEEVFQCLQSASKERTALIGDQLIGDPHTEYEYKSVPFYTFLLTALILIFEGYIISCLIVFINKKREIYKEIYKKRMKK